MCDSSDGTVTGTIDVGDRTVSYRIEHRDVQYARLSVQADGTVLVAVPTTMERTERLLTNNRRWIEQRLATERAAAQECGVSLSEARETPVLFGQVRHLDVGVKEAGVGLEHDKLHLPMGCEPADPAVGDALRDLLRDEVERLTPDVEATLEVSAQAVAVDDNLPRWSDHTTEGMVIVHPRSAILPTYLLEHLIFRELLFYKEAANNRSYWGGMVEGYPDYNTVTDRLLGFWLLSHANDFWNSVLETT